MNNAPTVYGHYGQSRVSAVISPTTGNGEYTVGVTKLRTMRNLCPDMTCAVLGGHKTGAGYPATVDYRSLDVTRVQVVHVAINPWGRDRLLWARLLRTN